MKRFLTLTTIAILTVLLLLGIYAPMSYPMLFAATTEDYTIIRAGLIMVLLSLLVYEPPREPTFRVALAVVATLLMFSASSIVVNYEIKLFDAMILLETAILLYIEAAELNVAKVPATNQLPVTRSSRRNKLQAA